ncbi:unnamed protein product [Natator depressus]
MTKFKDSLLSSQRLHKAKVTLDPDTAHPDLLVSADRRRVRWGDTRQDLPDNPERFDTKSCMLGCEGFTSGRHYWEVEVGVEAMGVCAVGVARQSVRRKRRIHPNPEEGIWAVPCSEDQYRALTSPGQSTPLSPSRAPRRIRVYLDYDGGAGGVFRCWSRGPDRHFPAGRFCRGENPPALLGWC